MVNTNVAEKAFRVDITATQIPRDLALSSQLGEATVWLRGSKEDLEAATERVQATALPINPHAGRTTAAVEPLHPPELTLVRVNPSEITMDLEEVVTRAFEITCELRGEPSPGYILGDPRLRPSMAEITGAKSTVDSVNRVVVRVDAASAMLGQPQSGVVKALTATGRAVSGIQVEPQTAIVVVPVEHSVASKILPVFVSFRGQVEGGYRVAEVGVEPSLVTVAGDAAAVKSLTSVSTLPLSLRGVSSSFARRMQLVVPESVASMSETTVMAVSYTHLTLPTKRIV